MSDEPEQKRITLPGGYEVPAYGLADCSDYTRAKDLELAEQFADEFIASSKKRAAPKNSKE